MESDYGGYRTGNTYRRANFKGARLHRRGTVSSDLWRWGVRCKHPGAYRISQKAGKDGDDFHNTARRAFRSIASGRYRQSGAWF